MSTPNNAIQLPSGTTTTPPSGKLRRRTLTLGDPPNDDVDGHPHFHHPRADHCPDNDYDDYAAELLQAMNGGAVNGVGGGGGGGAGGVMATMPRKKRLRGRSLRSNVLLRPRRLSIPAPSATAATAATTNTITAPPTEEEAEEVGARDSDDDDDTDSTDDGSDSDDDDDDDDCYSDGSDEEGAGGLAVYRARSGSITIIAAGRSRQEEDASAQDTVFWGWVVLLSTWVVFVVGMGSVVGVWEWAWGAEPKVGRDYFFTFLLSLKFAEKKSVSERVSERKEGMLMRACVGSIMQNWPRSVGGEKAFGKKYPGAFPIPGYHPAMCILTCIMAWVWVVTAWVGMKYFKHAKIQS